MRLLTILWRLLNFSKSLLYLNCCTGAVDVLYWLFFTGCAALAHSHWLFCGFITNGNSTHKNVFSMEAQVAFLFVGELQLIGGHYSPASRNVIAQLMADDHIALARKRNVTAHE